MESPSPKAPFVHAIFSAIAGRYDLANHLLSGGLDYLWRRKAARLVGSWRARHILDLATGSGDLALSIQAACPSAEVIGADFCHPMLQIARRKGLWRLVTADAMRLPFAESAFDVVTVAFGLRNMQSLSLALSEMARVIAADGHLLILDFSIPPPPLRSLYRLYLHRIVPKLAAFLTGEKAAYEYLGASIEDFPSGEALCALIRAQGFAATSYQRLTGGIVSLYTARRI